MRKMKFLGNKISLILLMIGVMNPVFAQKELSQVDTLFLTLEQSLEVALSSNPTMKVAGKEIELKKEARFEAFAGLFPEVSLDASYTRTLKKQTMAMDFQGQSTVIEVGQKNSYTGGVNVSLPIFAPALYKSINLTKADVELAVEKARSSRLDLINQVTKAFYQLLLTQDSYNVLLKSYAQAEANYNLIKAKFDQGSVSEYDKIRAEVQMRSLKPSVVSARNGVNLASLQLKVLMGMSSNLCIGVLGNLKDYEETLFSEQLVKDSINLSANSDLKQLDLNVKLLSKSLQLERTNFMPTLAAHYNYMYTTLSETFRFKSYDWFPYSTIGLTLSIPVFKASNFTKVKQTKIQMQQLTYNRTDIERQLNMQARSYQDNMDASAEQVVSNRESVRQAEKGREIAKKRYEVGKGTILELNDSEVALTESQLTYNQSIYDYLIAKADLEKVLGFDNINVNKE